MISDKQGVRDIVRILAEKGLTHCVISPGSRHAPLSLSFHHDPRIKTVIVPDERAAGYFALGIAQATGAPCALLCTSGTAAANYGPAVAEAYYQQIPLIVLTADRPAEWIDQGDGQTIRQPELLKPHTLKSFHLPVDASHPDDRWYIIRSINEAWEIASGKRKGPVHVNIPLREPLYRLIEDDGDIPRLIDVMRPLAQLTSGQLDSLKKAFGEFERVMVLVGMGHWEAAVQQEINALNQLPQVLTLTETTSNLHGSDFIGCIDRLLMSLSAEEEEAMRPQLLITLGDQIISKKIKTFLRETPGLVHWHVGDDATFPDTYKALTKVISASPFQELASTSGRGSYSISFKERNRRLSAAQAPRVDALGWCDMQAFGTILKSLPPHSILQMGNSSVVRYIQLFDPRNDLIYYGNRGTSGIDGSTSTAAGMASATDKPVVLITGDMSYLYDINALWQEQLPDNLRIIVINNGGGGIFRIIDGPRQSGACETIFEARHERTMEHTAAHFGLTYAIVNNGNGLQIALEQLFRGDIQLLEVDTRLTPNDEMLRTFFKTLKTSNN